MKQSDSSHYEPTAYGTLQISDVQIDRLKKAIDRFVERFDKKKSDESPPTFASPSASAIDNWLLPPPSSSQISSDQELDQILETIESAMDTGIETGTGSMMSYIPGSELRSASLARYIASVQNRFTGAAFGCPGAVALEQSVINWMTSLFELGPSAGGVLLSGGSMANFTAIVTARNQIGDEYHDGVIYVSASAHHSVIKACRLAGISERNIRIIPLDDQYRIDTTLLQKQLALSVAAGKRPMMIVATAGTTDLGAIDSLGECAVLAEKFGAWMHVDAAYGGFFSLTARGRERLSDIGKADSITVDAHKGLFTPFGLGGLLVADRQHLLDAHSGTGAYMRDVESEEILPDFSALGPELTRPFRGLDLWLPLHLHGVSAFQNELDRMLDLAEYATAQLREIPFVEVIATPSLSVVCFRCVDGDDTTQRLLDTINESGVAHVSSTRVSEQLLVRLVFLNYRTAENRLQRVLEVVREFAAGDCGRVESLSDCA